jgi:transposase
LLKISKRLGVSYGTILKKNNKYHFVEKRECKRILTVEEVKNFLEEGLSCKGIAEKLDVSGNAVAGFVKRHDLRRYNQHRRRRKA